MGTPRIIDSNTRSGAMLELNGYTGTPGQPRDRIYLPQHVLHELRDDIDAMLGRRPVEVVDNRGDLQVRLDRQTDRTRRQLEDNRRLAESLVRATDEVDQLRVELDAARRMRAVAEVKLNTLKAAKAELRSARGRYNRAITSL